MATSNAMNKLIFKLHALADDYGIRSARGTLILVLDDANVQGIHTYKKFKKISENFETKNKEYMQIAFAEYGIKKLIVASGHNEGGIEVSIVDTLKILNRTYENGYVVAGEDCRTSASGIFAAGDVRKKALRQIITAVADGANAINSIQNYI